MKLTKSDSKLIIAIPSSRISPSMEFMLEVLLNANLDVLWLQHSRNKQSRNFTVQIESKNYFNLHTIKCETSDHHAEGFFLDGIFATTYSGWVLRLDDDELATKEFLESLVNVLDELNPKIAYSFPRIWVKRQGKIWLQSKLAKASKGETDNQIRLFHTDHVSVDKGLHTPGFKYKKSRKLNLGHNLIHLIWEIESIDSRILKVRKYEELTPGAGIGKLRYYMPELFPDERHEWTKLKNQFEVDTLEQWNQESRLNTSLQTLSQSKERGSNSE